MLQKEITPYGVLENHEHHYCKNLHCEKTFFPIHLGTLCQNKL